MKDETKAKKIHGKNFKRTIHKLDPQFREKILEEAIRQDGIFAPAIAISFATGCRPAELKNGVKVVIDPANQTFRFEISGAKVSESRGIEKRIFVTKINLDMGPSWQKYLISMCAGNEISIKIDNAKSYGNAVTNISKKLWPRRAEQASPYSFRHALATDLKSSWLDKITIASVMGHLSTASQNAYGRKRSGGRKMMIERVETSREIKTKSPLDRFKRKSKSTSKPLKRPLKP